MNLNQFNTALKEADIRMKSNNGHSYVVTLKTRCIYCGASRKRKTKCRGWFMTFTDRLREILLENGVIE